MVRYYPLATLETSHGLKVQARNTSPIFRNPPFKPLVQTTMGDQTTMDEAIAREDERWLSELKARMGSNDGRQGGVCGWRIAHKPLPLTCSLFEPRGALICCFAIRQLRLPSPTSSGHGT